jgi:hypothetical protein
VQELWESASADQLEAVPTIKTLRSIIWLVVQAGHHLSVELDRVLIRECPKVQPLPAAEVVVDQLERLLIVRLVLEVALEVSSTLSYPIPGLRTSTVWVPEGLEATLDLAAQCLLVAMEPLASSLWKSFIIDAREHMVWIDNGGRSC